MTDWTSVLVICMMPSNDYAGKRMVMQGHVNRILHFTALARHKAMRRMPVNMR